ncbi:hypothetical protein HPULCUR_009373 [Helicostylum pulchrum]|uniref:HTH myb-type domain-containing protein n=1 Tax=Helicostylum pulchrum TaxID=562976 RepID=A0ABP9YBB6_9FUNG
MRPNNAITKEKQGNPAKEAKNNSSQEKQALIKAESPDKAVSAATKEKPKQVHSESASELKLAEKVHKQEKKAKTKTEKKAGHKAKKSKTKHVMNKNLFRETKTVEPLSSTPVPKVYESASDSDETDEEDAANPTRKAEPKAVPKAAPKAAPKADPKPKPKADPKPTRKADPKVTPEAEPKADLKRKAEPEPTPTEAAKIYESDSDSDETDKEEDVAAKKSNKRKIVDGKVKYRTSDVISDSESDSDSNKEAISNVKKPYKSMDFHLQKTDNVEHLKANRISFRKKRDYDENMTAAENIKGRLNDLFVPSVKDDEFISDSESDTDSGEDYETREYPSWQRTLSLKHNKEKDPWPTQRKFGYSDKLKLEKRIKKICKREGLSFGEAREIFSSSKRRPHIRFFQKIAKVFPNMSLHALAKQCKMMYHVKRVSAPWTPGEIAKLKELIEEHGTSPTTLSEYMERSPKNISDFMYNHMSTDSKRWEPEEDQIIAKAAAKLGPGQSFSATALVSEFYGTRTPKQIHRRYYTLRHLIKEDGTIEPKRKATLSEELDYLKGLLKQAEDLGLEEESQLDYSKNKGFVASSFYLKSRCTINGFEKMHIKEILEKLIKRQERIIESRRHEKLLGRE